MQDDEASPEGSRENEDRADEIQKEWRFKISRFPENTVARIGIVNIVLLFLQILLIISNNVWYLGYWEAFTKLSTRYRDAVRGTHLAQRTNVDSIFLDSYSLWRGWIVPSFLAGFIYVFTALLALRHELYHWKPELLQHYLNVTKASKIGRHIPDRWLDFWFQIYKDYHRAYISAKIQPRKHRALDDSEQFLKVLRAVGFNLAISSIAILVFWIAFLQTSMDSGNIVQLPKSYVPTVQGVVWYLCNDFFYFYPHWIAHKSPGTNALYSKILPRSIAEAFHKQLNYWHKPHHQSKVNLGIAAWYCSPWEQVFFNLFPALIGPLLTQILADAAGVNHIWGTHIVTLYVWIMAATASSVLAHSGYRSRWNDPGKHDLHHERAFNPKTAVNFGTLGAFDWLHGTGSSIPEADAKAWRTQRDRQAALYIASKRSGIPLTKEQTQVVKQPDHSEEWLDKSI